MSTNPDESSDGEYEEYDEEVEELVVFRFPQLMDAASTGIDKASIKVSGLDTDAPTATFGNGMAFKGRWATIPNNAAVVGLHKIPADPQPVSTGENDDDAHNGDDLLVDQDLVADDKNSVDGVNLNPQSIEDVKKIQNLRQLREARRSQKEKEDQEIAQRFAPSFSQRFRPTRKIDPNDKSQRTTFAVDGLGTPTRMIIFRPSASALVESAKEMLQRKEE